MVQGDPQQVDGRYPQLLSHLPVGGHNPVPWVNVSDGGEDGLPHGPAVAEDVALVDEGAVRQVPHKVGPGPIVHEAVL